ncbi:WhiB family transcriptional regulator [Hoyosella altamirensis]|uniref:4Fe-4S Wbl-type domain-containing protein n=1 Tax=Hoyosella altamirensis TaxID=616997 RepID=A0A839RMQ4_9ACTN|nr:WhiB family transcriptional regulator [Hoyosella altamirensis]MBB3037434.1 hypothetical protein [Hoyosella altamirensis]MBB3037451.1 hypothetical protein [Hoyosella altamirensis]
MKIAKPPSIPKLSAALAALVDERLVGARCAGRAPLFDSFIEGETPAARIERFEWCAHLCRACPVLAACDQAASELTAAERTGIWASADRSPTVGRPPKEGAA